MKIYPSMMTKDKEEQTRMRAELADVTFPDMLGRLDKHFAANGAPFCVGQALTTADLFLYVFIRWISKGVLDGIPKTVADAFPQIKAIVASVEANEKVKEWRAMHP